MNKVILMGRLTRDPEVRYSQGENATAILVFLARKEKKDRKDATECENGHKKAKKIIKQVHQPHNLNMSGYPLKLEVEMSDGTKLMYKRG